MINYKILLKRLIKNLNVSHDECEKSQYICKGMTDFHKNWHDNTDCVCEVHGNISHKHTHTHPFNCPFSGTTRVSRYQKGKTNLYFTEARDSEWQWHQLGHMQVCISFRTDNYASTPPLKFFTGRMLGCPSCRPANSVKALKALHGNISVVKI